MEETLDIPPMDLKASAESEVRKLQDMVKKLEKQNEKLRYTQNGAYGGGVSQKRESFELEDVTLINLNDCAGDLEDSWLYESPVKSATPIQKSINSSKWVKTVTTEGLDDVRKCLIDKLDDIEAQQEISKVRTYQHGRQESKMSSVTTTKDSLFFQPANRLAVTKGRRNIGQPEDTTELKPEINLYEDFDQGGSPHSSIEDLEDDEPQGPILRRSALAKENDSKNNLQRTKKTTSQAGFNSPIESRSLSDTSSGTRTPVSPSPDENTRIQPRSRRIPLISGDDNGSEKETCETSPQNSLDDLDDDIHDKSPVMRRSALALPKPSPEGLSKQLWYSGPVNQMNRHKTKNDPSVTRIRRSASPSPDRRSKLQPRSAGPASGAVVRRSSGARGSVEDLLDFDDDAPVQRRSLPQVPTDSNATRSRLDKSDESIGARTQLKPRSKAQNLQTPISQGGVVTRRSLLTPPGSGNSSPKISKLAVARRKPPPQNQNDADFDESWKEGCF